MTINVYIVKLPVNPRLSSMELNPSILNKLSGVMFKHETDEQINISQINVKDIQQTDRLILLLAAPDVSVLKLRVPPLSRVNLELAVPALLEEALGSRFNDCRTVLCDNFLEKDGSAYASIAVCDKSWIDFIKMHFSTSSCKYINIYPMYEVIPREVLKCSFLIDFDEINSIAWCSGSSSGGGAQLFHGQEGINATVYADSIVKANYIKPEDSIYYSGNFSSAWQLNNQIYIDFISLAKQAFLTNKKIKYVDFNAAPNESSIKFTLKNLIPNRLITILIVIFTIQFFVASFQHWNLDAKKNALNSELIGRMSGKDPATLSSVNMDDRTIQNALRQLRYAEGSTEDSDFIILESLLVKLLPSQDKPAILALNYKNSTLYVTAEDNIELNNNYADYLLIAATKIKPGYWKIAKVAK